MKRIIANLLVFTIGIGVNGLYCKAETEPSEKIDAKVTQTALDRNTEKTKSDTNKEGVTLWKKLKELASKVKSKVEEKKNKSPGEKLAEKEKLKKEIIENLGKVGVSILGAFVTVSMFVSFFFIIKAEACNTFNLDGGFFNSLPCSLANYASCEALYGTMLAVCLGITSAARVLFGIGKLITI